MLLRESAGKRYRRQSRDLKGLKGSRRASKDFGVPTMDVGEPRAELKGLQETRKGLRGQGRSERQPEALYRASRLFSVSQQE